MNIKNTLKIIILTFSMLVLAGCTSQDTLSSTNTQPDTSESNGVFTETELSMFNGVDGERCLVGVNGIVYEISNSSFWLNGIHTKSEGKASCGKDLSDEITDAPHGVAILTTSPSVSRVGTLN